MVQNPLKRALFAQLLCHNILLFVLSSAAPTLPFSLSLSLLTFCFAGVFHCKYIFNSVSSSYFHHRPGTKFWKIRKHQGKRPEERQFRPEQSRGAQKVRILNLGGCLCKQTAHGENVESGKVSGGAGGSRPSSYRWHFIARIRGDLAL